MNKQVLKHLELVGHAGIDWIGKISVLPDSGSVNPLQASTASLPAEVPGSNTLGYEGRIKALELLRGEVSKCVACSALAKTRKQTVFGVGKVDPEICFVGEAPGATEDEVGEPFVGEAGQLLNKILVACGMTREDVYICNIIRCRPPGNRLPLPDEAANCRKFLEAQLGYVHPRVIVCLGACAAQNLLDTKTPISKMRGSMHDWRGIPVMCTFHPAYLLRNPEKKKDVWDDMKGLMGFLGRKIPGKT